MDGKAARQKDPLLDHPTIPAAPPARARANGLSENWAAVLGLGWPVVFWLSGFLEPRPANPQAALTPIEVVVVGAFLVGLLATSVLAGTRQRAAAPAAVITGLVTVAMVVSCPVSGHHHFGAWWLAGLALVLAMLAVSVAGLRATARR